MGPIKLQVCPRFQLPPTVVEETVWSVALRMFSWSWRIVSYRSGDGDVDKLLLRILRHGVRVVLWEFGQRFPDTVHVLYCAMRPDASRL